VLADLAKRRARAQRQYERIADPALLMVALVFIASWVCLLIPAPEFQWRWLAREAFWVTWVMLVGDYFSRALLSHNPLRYIARNPLGLLAALIPPMRIFYLVRAFNTLHRGGTRLVGQAGIIGGAAFFLSIVIGSALALHYEYGHPNATITTYGDAIWWAFETTSTVGYGDFVPVTIRGRMVAVGLMIVGVGLASLVAGTLAGVFLRPRDASPWGAAQGPIAGGQPSTGRDRAGGTGGPGRDSDGADPDDEIHAFGIVRALRPVTAPVEHDLHARLAAIEEALARLEARRHPADVEAAAPGPAPGPSPASSQRGDPAPG